MSLFLALLPNANAQGALVWQWPVGETVNYTAELDMTAGFGMWFKSVENHQARAGQIEIKLALACTASEPTKRSQSIGCEIHDAYLAGTAVEGEEEELAIVLAEWERNLEQGGVQLEVSPTGRVRFLDLEGLPKDTSRESEIQEFQRLLVTRALAPLELELPKDGLQPTKAWKQKGSPLALRLPEPSGTAGGINMNHEIMSSDGSVLEIMTTGQATTMSGADAESDSHSPVALLLSGLAHFDTETGQLVDNTQVLSGDWTASAVTPVWNAPYVRQKAIVRRVDTLEGLGW
jgi:hypothetical protein